MFCFFVKSAIPFSDASGQTSVKFGVLFNDDRCANIFEALVGTLKAAKKRKVIAFQSELLLQGVHDDVDIVLLQEWELGWDSFRSSGSDTVRLRSGAPAVHQLLSQFMGFFLNLQNKVGWFGFCVWIFIDFVSSSVLIFSGRANRFWTWKTKPSWRLFYIIQSEKYVNWWI